ncbi:MAG: hypothetical protein EPN46_11620 [Candidimonas sp.]|nr:MAG: hypothetical protein EPN77_03535 [Candidimonas sp.]TAM27177.1 MAG: hypothetical protein EPN62_00225 [Candidimonas sp.]TAM74830.1 MAG: hypothetical protein EPN46_11620 [Candidimonas sp.]
MQLTRADTPISWRHAPYQPIDRAGVTVFEIGIDWKICRLHPFTAMAHNFVGGDPEAGWRRNWRSW